MESSYVHGKVMEHEQLANGHRFSDLSQNVGNPKVDLSRKMRNIHGIVTGKELQSLWEPRSIWSFML